MTAPEFEAHVVAWARTLPDLEALVQIGSRVQAGATVDEWSDWDYQLVLRSTARYRNLDWAGRIAPCWNAHHERTPRGVDKVSAVFAGGREADFVLLTAWQIRLVCAAMRRPDWAAWYPAALRLGIHNLRLVARPGHRVILGGAAWERRFAALAADWPEPGFSAGDFEQHVAAFWRHATWVARKILRGELRAALRWKHVELREHLYALLAEAARLEGRRPRPEARQAEQWLDDAQRQLTAHVSGPQPPLLARALLAEMTLFRETSERVAARRGFPPPGRAALEAWLRAELAKAAG